MACVVVSVVLGRLYRCEHNESIETYLVVSVELELVVAGVDDGEDEPLVGSETSPEVETIAEVKLDVCAGSGQSQGKRVWTD